MAAPFPYDAIPKRRLLSVAAKQARKNYMQIAGQLTAATLDPATINVKNVQQAHEQALLFAFNLAEPFGQDQFPPRWKRALWNAFSEEGETEAWADEDAMVADLVAVRDAALALSNVVKQTVTQAYAELKIPTELNPDGSIPREEVVATLDKAQNAALLTELEKPLAVYGPDLKA